MGHSSYPRSSILILGQSCIYSLLPSTLSAQVDSLLQNGLLSEAEALLDKAEAGLAQGTTSSGDQTETLRYLHQCLAFAFMRQTRFREATTHFVRGAIDPRVPISYFHELRPSLFGETSGSLDGKTPAQSEGDYVDVEVWDGVREYMPEETSVDDLIAINLVRNYSPYLRPGAIPGSPEDLPDTTSSTSASESGTRTHPATIAMREGLRVDAADMVKSILAAVLGNAEVWSRDIIEVTSTALALLYTHSRDVQSLLALFAPPPPPPPSTLSSRPVSRAGSRPPSRPGSTSQIYLSNGHPSSSPSDIRHTPSLSQTISSIPAEPALPFRPGVLAPVLAQSKLWGVLVEMWKVIREGEKVLEILVGLSEGTYIDPSVVDPLEQIFMILSPTRLDPSSTANGIDFSLSEPERSRLVRKWAAWLSGKDVERGMKLLTSLQPSRPRRATGAAGRGRDKAAEREETQKADELGILSELRNTNVLAAKRYLEWLVVGRGLGRGGKETREEMELFEELVWSCVQEVLDYVADESVGKLWKAKAASYASSPSTSTSMSVSPPPPKSPSPSPTPLPSQPARSPFLSYFSSTTPDSPSKRARIKTILVLESLGEGKEIVRDIQDKIVSGGWDKTLGLEMAILYSKIPSARTTLRTLHGLRDTSTAESYASSSGASGVVSAKVGVSAAEGCGLAEWGGWFARGGTSGGGGKEGDMPMMLLEVYMEDGDAQQTARLLSSQATKLDVIDITPLVPPSWPLRTLSTYLTRSLRRSQHIAHEGQIVKAICAGQNLAVLENAYEVLRDEGAIVEEAVSDEEDEDGGDENEKPERGGQMGRSFDEKVGLHGREGEGGVEVVDVHVGSVS